MKGDFSRLKGDLSRHTFARLKHYAGVLHQQGRVWLDSDWNTEVLLQLNLLRQETFDIIGRCGAPAPGTAFAISPPLPGNPLDAFEISGGPGPEGRYYVDGILCQLDRTVNYLTQPDFPDPPRLTIPPREDLTALVYIEVWQRLITYLEDEDIREVALGGPDTATRVKTIAQVKVATLPRRDREFTCEEALATLPVSGGTLTALQPTDTLPPDPCRLPDPASYTGRENHLYRVEIHDGGDVSGADQGFVFSIKLASDTNAGAVNLSLVSALTKAEASALGRSGFVMIASDDGQLERAPLSNISTDGRAITLGRGLLNSFTTARNATVTGGVARFKWSRDNASFGVRVTAISPDRRTLTVASLGRDQITTLREGDLVEIVDDASELGPARGHLTNLTADPNPDTFTVTIADGLPSGFGAAAATTVTSPPQTLSPPAPDGVADHLLLRRWDGQGMAQAIFNETTTPQLNLGDGVHIQFGGSKLQSGDYWQFAARSIDGSIEVLNNAPPMGISRHRCALAIVRWDNQAEFDKSKVISLIEQSADISLGASKQEVVRRLIQFPTQTITEANLRALAQEAGATPDQIKKLIGVLVEFFRPGRSRQPVMTVVEDCREPFRPLTDLECDCKCTLIARPGPNWEQVFNQIRAGQDAEICFQVGQYPVTNTVVVEGKGNLILTGSGIGSHINAPGGETAIRFVRTKSVKVRDLSAESGRAGEGFNTPLEHLNGVLAFDTCGEVELEHVTLKCGAGKWRSATCVTVTNSPASNKQASFPRCDVRINQCDLNVGHLQIGVLLLNVSRAHVEDNTLRSVPLPPNRTFRDVISDRLTRTLARRLLVSDARTARTTLGAVTGTTPGAVPPATPAPVARATLAAVTPSNTTPVVLRAGRHRLDFNAPEEIPQAAWTELLQRNPPPANVDSPAALLKHVNGLVDQVLLQEVPGGVPAPFRNFVRALALQPVSVAAQGIVVGGSTTPEVRIVNNSVADVVQGIHLGLSTRGSRENRLRLGIVTISGNRIAVVLTADAVKKEKHGIFIGNCDSLLIENNHVSLSRLSGATSFRIDGIRVWGVLGNRALITQNYCFPLNGNPKLSFDIGIDFHPLNEKPGGALWIANYNVAPSRVLTILLPPGADVPPGTNVP